MAWNVLMRIGMAMQQTGLHGLYYGVTRRQSMRLLNAGSDLHQWAMHSKWPDTYLARRYWARRSPASP